MDESQVFAHALKLANPVERAAYLVAACGDNPKLQEEVEALLRAHDTNPGFLEQPVAAIGMDTLPGAKLDANAGNDLGFLTTSDRPDALGRVAHYEILEVIGRGGMGIVLRALDEKLHRVAAIKVMAAQLATNATARKRFTREAQAAAAVTHDHIVTIYAVDEAAGLPYLAMQYIAGVSLQQRIDRSGPLQLEEILRIGMQTASGLAAAHAQGLIHRDIKPANILLENGVERVKITDFGLARAADDANLTQSGMVAGTPHYMSPEQAQGTTLDQRSDLFSLGSVMYAMCTGRAPFRASGTVAVLKRVCDETPTPVGQINSAIPTWLTAIIERLHAKDPADRYQSAAEVAEVLGRHLAHVQHPSVMPLPYAVSAPAQSEPAQRISLPNRSEASFGNWWTVAGVLLVLLFGGLSLTEATGVTRLVPTVIRILTPDGTLVVETDDPAIKVTIEGDGGLTIIGAGLEEIRLKPGSYKLQAAKDGKPIRLDQELITITHGDRRLVKVRLQGEAVATPVVAATGKDPFVLLAAGQQRHFTTLAEAVHAASDGDTIEVRGNGPFFSEPINIHRTTLTIRAGDSFRPVIKLNPEAVPRDVPLLATSAPLVLEGLELTRTAPEDPVNGRYALIKTHQAPLRAANCRFSANVYPIHSPVCEFRNCEFFAAGGVGGEPCSGARVVLENCLRHWKAFPLFVWYEDDALEDMSIEIKRCTFVSDYTPLLLECRIQVPVPTNGSQASNPIRLEVSDSIFDTSAVLGFHEQRDLAVLPPAEAEAALLRLLLWRGERNLFAAGSTGIKWHVDGKGQPPHGPKTLKEWTQFWGGAESDSLEGRIRFQGGSRIFRSDAALDQSMPEDFRLRADSAGYRAGPDGKDLGADVDLVGPGPAYERWKKTKEHQEWLKESGQQE